ncbi:MAG: ABC transporter ATP-binding protein [Candidatus Sumerlaeota bacterium]|nr:ABC transporter ATP-binding protein [Candidatus Sumerlaeota bacterium]
MTETAVSAALPSLPPLTIGRFLKVFLRYLPCLKSYWVELLLILFVAPLAGSVLVVIAPLCTKMIIDVAFPRRDIAMLVILAFVGFGSLILDRVLLLLRAAVYGHLRIGVLARLGPRFYSNMMRLNMNYHRRNTVGDKIFFCDTDVLDTSEMVGIQFPFMVQYFYQFVMVVFAMCFLDWRPVAIAFAITPLWFVIGQLIFNFYRRIDLSQRLLGQKLTTQLERTLSSIPLVYSHAARHRERFRYFIAMARYSVANMLFWFVKEVTIVFVWPSEMPRVLTGAIIGLCGYWVVTGEMTVGEWSALTIYIAQAIVPLGILITYYQNMRLRMVAAERVLGVLDLKEHMSEPAAADTVTLDNLRGAIEFRGVNFHYDPEKPVLRDISFRIEPGSMVAFVGESGSGKSTILNLILRFYDPQQGRVLIDDVDLRNVRLREYRQKIGIVLQEPVLFHRTIRDNIIYGSKGASDEQLAEAARIARLDELISSLPNGYDAVLGEGGDLSLGQKQRISVARCVVGNPSILLLDEPASLLDPPAQRTLTETLFEAAQGRTTILVSHDLTKLTRMDQIFVMDNGRLIESGTHQQLLSRGGHYHKLWIIQSQTGGAAAKENDA